MIIAVLSTSAVTGAVIEIIRGIVRWIGRRRSKGFAKLESEVTEIKDTIEKLAESVNGQEETRKVILHDRIWDVYRKLHKDADISVTDKANLDYMYKEYKKLKGNHKAEIMYNEIKKKPIRKEMEL
ncbi:MAG: hypothetical protein ACOX4I_00610 [Anaerovoracaceae bacterium]|jgi:uncharacterized FlgJ-related protein